MDGFPKGTKLALILAAGELFAENGFEGTSVRAIAKRANAHVASVNYHFGNKENLYTETLRYVLMKGGDTQPGRVPLDDERLQSREGIAEIILEVVRAHFAAYFLPDDPDWHLKLVIRSLLDPTPSLQVIVKQIFEPDHEALRKLFRLARPDFTEEQTRLWAITFVGQIAVYYFCRLPILTILGLKEYDPPFLDSVAEHVAVMMTDSLGLPRPSPVQGGRPLGALEVQGP
ncbi:MAG: CerR family C-terminal domain-containing protein [Nitrospiraceae bacterium]|nr:CerR family C-terminal domain-containing protein [Nitrospiraceae bacterium]